jgi:hypothetical protein
MIHSLKIVAATLLSLSFAEILSPVQFDSADYKSRGNLTVASSTNTYAQAVNYGKTHPTRDGESWSGWYHIVFLNFSQLV